MVDTWVLPTLTEVLALADRVGAGQLFPNVGEELTAPSDGEGLQHSLADHDHNQRMQHQWRGAIAALDTLLQRASANPSVTDSPQSNAPQHGIVISGPLPVLTHPGLTAHYATWLFKVDTVNPLQWLPFQLLPGAKCDLVTVNHPILPLLPIDPLTSEQFCLVLTAQFSLVLALGRTHDGTRQFQFSFVPEVVEAAWKALRSRISLTAPHYLHQWDRLFQHFPPVAPDYRWVMQFSQLVLTSLPTVVAPHPVSPTEVVAASHSPAHHRLDRPIAGIATPHPPGISPPNPSADTKAIDVELLQAIAHEIRTPLATIRTLTRLLLKRKNLAPDLLQHLQAIDRECTEQIDRFGLIFRAAELETCDSKRPAMPLMPMSVAQVFQHSIPRWQQQANQRQHTLDVILPPKMPTVVSDPTMLDQVLTSLIERFTRSLPSGSHIQVQVVSAGSQLKLQLQAQANGKDGGAIANNGRAFATCSYLDPSLKSLGQLLMFQPETGSLSLNLSVTKNLFQALGAKLIVRQRPDQGEVLTIFLPLERV